MPGHLGDYDASTVVYGKFTTFQPSTGAAFTLGGTPALSVYKDNSTTESTAGVTLTVDFDGRTGFNHFAIDTSADGTFYSAGSFFYVVITTGTVDSVNVVGSVVGSFTIRKDSSLKPATAGRTLVVDAAGLADATTVKLGPSGSGTAQTARDIGASVLLSSGTGAGQILLSSGTVTAGTVSDKTGYSLSASGLASVTAWTVAITGNITGNLSGSVGSVTGLNAALLDAAVSTRATPTDVLTAVEFALATDTYAEPTGAPPATNTLALKIGFIYEVLRNEITVTGSTKTFFNNSGIAQWSKALTDDGTTFTEAKGA